MFLSCFRFLFVFYLISLFKIDSLKSLIQLWIKCSDGSKRPICMSCLWIASWAWLKLLTCCGCHPYSSSFHTQPYHLDSVFCVPQLCPFLFTSGSPCDVSHLGSCGFCVPGSAAFPARPCPTLLREFSSP